MIAPAPAPRPTSSPLPAALHPHAQLLRRIAEAAREPNVTELDVRGGTPPKPVPAILAALKGNPPGRSQFVRTATAPVDLLRALEAKGVEAYPVQLADGSWRTLLISRTASNF